MFQTGSNEWLGFVSSKGADGTRPIGTEGTAITPGASNTWGSYASLGVLSASFDVLEIEIVIHTVTVAGANRMVSIDVAVDPAGGTAFAGNNVINDLLVGSPGGLPGSLECRFAFPVRIPAGASIGVRGASLNATVTAFRVSVGGHHSPTRPDLIRYGASAQTFGVATSGVVAGTTITPGTTAEGAWVEIGTLTKPLFYFDFGYVIDDITMTTGQIDVDIALGDATNKRLIVTNYQIATSANESLVKKLAGRYALGAVGDKIYARAQSSVAIDDLNSIAVYGVG